MIKKQHKVLLAGILGLALLAVASIGMASISWSAEGATVTATMSGVASEFRVTYNITVENTSTSTVRDVYLAGALAEGARFVEATNTPAGAAFLGQQGNNVGWSITELGPKSKIGPFSYRVSVSGKTAGSAHAWVRWSSPSEGSVLSNEVAFDQVVIDGPKRGCESCHVLRDAATGAVTIAYEAKVRATDHPKLANETTVEQCLACHAPGKGEREGMGVVAPKMLRDIVHPAHMNSSSFTGTYKGNCFTCHNVDGAGRFTLLGSKLKTDFRGIPMSPVKGILPQ